MGPLKSLLGRGVADLGVGNVRPMKAVDNGPNRRRVNTKLAPNRRVFNSRLREPSNFSNVALGEFGLSRSLSSRLSCAPLGYHVGHIVGMAPHGEVGRIHAGRNVAAVHDARPLWGADDKSVSQNGALRAAPLENAVAFSVARTGPQPATIRLLNEAPKPFFRGGWLHRHGVVLTHLAAGSRGCFHG